MGPRRWWPRLGAVLLLWALAAVVPGSPVSAQEKVPVRVGDHPGHGRVVLDWPAPPAFTQEEAEDALVLRFSGGVAFDLAAARRPPRNVASLTAEADGLRIGLRPGASARVFRIGSRLVVDIRDPAAAAASAAPAQPQPRALAPAAEAAARPRPSRREPPAPPPPQPVAVPAPAPPPAPPPAPRPAEAVAPPAAPPVVLPRPAALVVRLLAPPGRDRAILLPYPTATGAAMLRRGSLILALFDSAEPLDITALRNDPVFAGLEVESLPGATLLRLPLAPPAILRARREAAGWVLEATRPGEQRDVAGTDRTMMLDAQGGATPRITISAAQPNRVVPLTDPETGMPLLFGTVRAAGQSMPTARRLPELDLPPTLLGAAVLARADQVTMRTGPEQFIIAAGSGRLALDLAAVQPAPSDAMTRSFDLTHLPPAQLLDRLRALNASIAAAPPLTRLPLRRAAGETMLALGLPQEAQSLLGLAPGEDPQAATDPRLATLVGVAALLSGRLPQAMPLRTADLPDTDELTLWRAVLIAALGDARAAAPGLAATLPLLFDYPEGLRARLLPPVALALAEAGATPGLKQLLDRAGPRPELALPRAMLAEAEGNAAAALAGYDQVAQGRDRMARARALRRAVELRLATGQIDKAQAAKALEATIHAWRDESEEAGIRIRVAELRRESGDARGALALLRETEALFADRAAQLRPAIGTAFLGALQQEEPLAAVALFDAYPELLPGDQAGEAALLMLADRLVTLDLAERAATLLGQAAERAQGVARAALGLRQAALRFADGDADATLAALEASLAAPLPEPLMRERRILAARAQGRLGQREEAVAALRGLGSAGTEPLSQMLIDLQDWTGAATAFAGHLRDALPPAPAPLDEAQRRLVLRQAALLVLSGDEAALGAWRGDFAPRLQGGPMAEAFTLLTADQQRGLADLPRLQRELQLFRSMPSRLEALRAGGPVTR